MRNRVDSGGNGGEGERRGSKTAENVKRGILTVRTVLVNHTDRAGLTTLS